MLWEGYKMSPSEAAEELEGVQSDLRKRETEVNYFNESNRFYEYRLLSIVKTS